MARKSSRKQTTTKRLTAVPPKAKIAPASAHSETPAGKVAAVAAAPTICTGHAHSAATQVEAKTPVVPAQPAIVAAEATEAPVITPVAAQDTNIALQTVLSDLQSTDPATRLEAVAEARRLEDRAALPALLNALGDGDADVAREVVAAIGAIGDESAVEPLIGVLKNAEGYYHTVVRAAAARSLAQLGDLRAVDPLLDAISDPSAEASAEAIRALATLGDSRALDALIGVVRNPNGYFLQIARRAAVLALAQIGGERATAELRAIASDLSEDTTIRDTAEAATQEGLAAHNP